MVKLVRTPADCYTKTHPYGLASHRKLSILLKSNYGNLKRVVSILFCIPVQYLFICFFDIGCLNNISTTKQSGVYPADFFGSGNIKLYL